MSLLRADGVGDCGWRGPLGSSHPGTGANPGQGRLDGGTAKCNSPAPAHTGAGARHQLLGITTEHRP